MSFLKKSALILLPIFLVVATAFEDDPFCLLYNAFDECTMCTLGKIPHNNKCVDAIQNCLEFSREYTCTACEVGYDQTPDGKCSAKCKEYDI